MKTHLGCPGQNTNIFSHHEVLFRVAHEENKKKHHTIFIGGLDQSGVKIHSLFQESKKLKSCPDFILFFFAFNSYTSVPHPLGIPPVFLTCCSNNFMALLSIYSAGWRKESCGY